MELSKYVRLKLIGVLEAGRLSKQQKALRMTGFRVTYVVYHLNTINDICRSSELTTQYPFTSKIFPLASLRQYAEHVSAVVAWGLVAAGA